MSFHNVFSRLYRAGLPLIILVVLLFFSTGRGTVQPKHVPTPIPISEIHDVSLEPHTSSTPTVPFDSVRSAVTSALPYCNGTTFDDGFWVRRAMSENDLIALSPANVTPESLYRLSGLAPNVQDYHNHDDCGRIDEAHLHQAARALQWQWHTPRCQLRPFDPERMATHIIQSGGMFMVGDSITTTHSYSLWRMLGDYLNVERQESVENHRMARATYCVREGRSCQDFS